MTLSLRCRLDVGPKKRSLPARSLLSCRCPPHSRLIILSSLLDPSEMIDKDSGLAGVSCSWLSSSMDPFVALASSSSASSDAMRPYSWVMSFREFESFLSSTSGTTHSIPTLVHRRHGVGPEGDGRHFCHQHAGRRIAVLQRAGLTLTFRLRQVVQAKDLVSVFPDEARRRNECVRAGA